MSILSSFTDSSVKYRGQIFDTTIPMIKDYYLTGLGLGTDIFSKIIQNYKIHTLKAPAHTHIFYTQILLEMGIAGLVAFGWFIWRLIRRSVTWILESNDLQVKTILVASIASLIGILVIGLVEYIWFYPRMLVFFWVGVSISMTCLNILNEERVKTSV